jgi:hypothetical protein
MAAGFRAEKAVAPPPQGYVGFSHVRGSVDDTWEEVTRMLNMISDLEAAVDVRARFGTGAALPSGIQTAQPACTGVALARPRAFWAADVFGGSRVATDPNVALGQRNPGKQHPYTTRIAAPSGGAKGPHPEREPVPV